MHKYQSASKAPFVILICRKEGVVRLALDKEISKAQICRDLEISKTSLYRIIGELEEC